MAEDNILDPEEQPIKLEGEDEPIRLEGEDAPLGLVEAEGAAQFAPGGVKTFGITGEAEHISEYKRSLNVDGTGATRCRLFHAKIAIAPLEHLERQINEWIDGDQIEIKHVGHLIGTMEGKRPEPNLLVIVWY
jgi:hypothetical protein